MCLGVVRHLDIYAIVELFTGSAESDLLTIRAYAAAVYRTVSDTAAHLLGGRVYWACRKRTVETAMLVCAYTRALHAPAMSGTIVQALSMLTFVASPEAVALTLP